MPFKNPNSKIRNYIRKIQAKKPNLYIAGCVKICNHFRLYCCCHLFVNFCLNPININQNLNLATIYRNCYSPKVPSYFT